MMRSASEREVTRRVRATKVKSIGGGPERRGVVVGRTETGEHKGASGDLVTGNGDRFQRDPS